MADPNVLFDGKNALHLACQKGYTAILRQLFANGADTRIRAPRCADSSALGFTARLGHIDAAQLLIDHQADVHTGLNNCATPLHVCAIMGHEKLAQLRVAAGAKVNVGVAQFLISQNAIIDARVTIKSCVTPLHATAINGHAPIIELGIFSL